MGFSHDVASRNTSLIGVLMNEMNSTAWMVCAFAIMLTGISKAAFGGALGGVGVPLMAMFLSPRLVVAVMLPILCVMDVFGVKAYWKKWSWTELKLILPGGLFGLALGALAIGFFPDRYVKALIGAIAVLFTFDRLFQIRQRLHWQQQARTAFATICATISGVTSTVAHAGGPPILVYLMARPLAKEQFVATTAVFFTVINAGKVIPYFALGFFTQESIQIAASLALFAPIGVWLGLRVLRLIPEKYFFHLATGLLGLSGVKLLLDSFW
ncbi:sulfite exporter TauE/SafE family protein [Undibacterium fentianense]|uniref:Probable membrane transporter protein n=1 Tax=Undibacterium fentianense TaxID=2828728 RepID=A0A941E1W5_9BURK|nr:sulfite exporter TauE/SafE family protein [Undibacterium fentianense]MBR7799866.1 sulfite exporter TauE/SafE family protein [Undibacterium fentianense]